MRAGRWPGLPPQAAATFGDHRVDPCVVRTSNLLGDGDDLLSGEEAVLAGRLGAGTLFAPIKLRPGWRLLGSSRTIGDGQ
jgi:hypothetical protein